MSVKHIISPGIGFSPGSVKYIVTRGLIAVPYGTVFGPEGRATVLFHDRRTYVTKKERRAPVLYKEKRSIDEG